MPLKSVFKAPRFTGGLCFGAPDDTREIRAVREHPSTHESHAMNSENPVSSAPSESTARPTPSMKDAFPFRVGAALPTRMFTGEDKARTDLVLRQFNSITPENLLKPGLVHPEENRFEFGVPDRYVEFGEKHRMKIIGHTLVWHQQTPDWFFTGPDGKSAGRELLISRMEKHIKTVVGRYKGRIAGWDVVNEAFEADGTMRMSKWLEIIGPEYIELAFRFAHEADPGCELYYNDFDMHSEKKRGSVVRMIREFRGKGVRIDAVGLQTHVSLGGPAVEEYEASVRAYIDAGVKVMATEVDVTVLPRGWDLPREKRQTAAGDPAYNPWPDGLPAEVEEAQAERYAELFGVFRKYAEHFDRVTFWCVDDGSSWLNNIPIKGRTDYPLLFGRDFRPKKAFYRIL